MISAPGCNGDFSIKVVASIYEFKGTDDVKTWTKVRKVISWAGLQKVH